SNLMTAPDGTTPVTKWYVSCNVIEAVKHRAIAEGDSDTQQGNVQKTLTVVTKPTAYWASVPAAKPSVWECFLIFKVPDGGRPGTAINGIDQAKSLLYASGKF